MPIGVAEWGINERLMLVSSPTTGGHVTNAFPACPHWPLAQKKSAGQDDRGRRCGVGRESGGGGLAATPGAGSGGQGDTELSQLCQVETGFVIGAEFVPSDGPPIGFRGQPPNTIQEATPRHVLLAELGSQVVGLADGAEFSEDLVKVIIGKVQVRLVLPEGFDVKGMAVRYRKALLFAGGSHPAPLAEVETVLQGCHGVIACRPGRAQPVLAFQFRSYLLARRSRVRITVCMRHSAGHLAARLRTPCAIRRTPVGISLPTERMPRLPN